MHWICNAPNWMEGGMPVFLTKSNRYLGLRFEILGATKMNLTHFLLDFPINIAHQS